MSVWLEGLADLPPVLTIVFKLTVLLGAGWLIHFSLYRCNPRWRVLLWRGVFAGLILLPLAEFVMPELRLTAPPPNSEPKATSGGAERPDVAHGTPALRLPSHNPGPLKHEAPTMALPDASGAAPPKPTRAVAPESSGSRIPRNESLPEGMRHHSAALLLVAWGLGVLFIGVRALTTLRRVRRIVRGSRLAPEQARDTLARVAEWFGCRTQVTLRVGQDLTSPFLAYPFDTGQFRPVIVLPERMIAESYQAELPSILAHELAHLGSRDQLWAVVGKGLGTLGWPHPFVWRMCAAHAIACEQVCDAVAAEYAGGATVYSRILARVALEVADAGLAAGGLPMLRSANITQRLRRLKRGVQATALARHWVVLATLLGAVTLAGLGGVKLARAESSPMLPTAILHREQSNFAPLQMDDVSPERAPTVTSLGLLRDITPTSLQSPYRARVCDWDGDGRSDIAAAGGGRFVVITSEGKILQDAPFPTASFDLVQDVDKDGKCEVFISWAEGKVLNIAMLDQSMKELKRYTTESGVLGGRPDSRILCHAVLDLDGDGQMEVIASVTTRYGLSPRGVWCFDLASADLMWTRLIAPYVKRVAFLDIDGDGKLDVVFGSSSPGNGNREADDSDDGHCYAFAVRHNGTALWMRQLGEHFSGTDPLVADVDGDRKPDILFRVMAPPDYRQEVGRLVRLSYSGEVLSSFDAGACIDSFHVLTTPDAPQDTILVTDRRGRIHRLDSDLNTIDCETLGSAEYDSIVANIIGVEDICGDEQPEIVVTYAEREFVSGRNPRRDRGPRDVRRFHNNAILVLGQNLLPVARYEVSPWPSDGRYPGFSALLTDADRGEKSEVVVVADRLEVLHAVDEADVVTDVAVSEPWRDDVKSDGADFATGAQSDVITDSIGIKLKLIPPGTFMMGSPDREAGTGRGPDEKPAREVTITKPFYIGVYEVTQEQWTEVMGGHPSSFVGARRPVETVSWEDVQVFLDKLSKTEGTKYRLPTEAEWEYACRAGTETRYYWGESWDNEYGWCEDSSGGATHDVGMKKPNAWGLHDMSGNVWEWCQDWYDRYPAASERTDPQGASGGRYRVVRGGSWHHNRGHCRSSGRGRITPNTRFCAFGFRVVRIP